MIFIDMRLSKRKIEKLNSLLSRIHKDDFNFDSLHGFLTAIYCAPEMLMPSSWMDDVNSKQIVKIAEKLGFVFSRQCGTSHAIYYRESDNRRTTIPIHGKKSLKRKTVKPLKIYR